MISFNIIPLDLHSETGYGMASVLRLFKCRSAQFHIVPFRVKRLPQKRQRKTYEKGRASRRLARQLPVVESSLQRPFTLLAGITFSSPNVFNFIQGSRADHTHRGDAT